MSEQSLRYFAYGSNLLTARLRSRVPSARPVHVGFVEGYDVRFHKRSVDGSGKATLVAVAGQRTYGCVFTIDAGEKLELDRVEGLGIGYAERVLRVEAGSGATEAFSYIAMPSHIDPALDPYRWYVALVHAGAREHGLPGHVIDRYAAQHAVVDPNPDRAHKHWALVPNDAVCDPTDAWVRSWVW